MWIAPEARFSNMRVTAKWIVLASPNQTTTIAFRPAASVKAGTAIQTGRQQGLLSNHARMSIFEPTIQNSSRGDKRDGAYARESILSFSTGRFWI